MVVLIFLLFPSIYGQYPLPQDQQVYPQSVGQSQSVSYTDSQGHNRFTEYDENLVLYGEDAGDLRITDNQRQNGLQIRLHNFFPYYGGRYNYTMISTNGFISFAYFSDDSPSMTVGLDVDWPSQSDPAVIAPYMCKQRIQSGQGLQSQIYYRLEVRHDIAQQFHNRQLDRRRQSCQGKPDYFKCDEKSDEFLDSMQKALMQGVAGASTFRAEAALVVTWVNMRPNIGSERGLATYQLVWLTDAQGLQSYTMINYNKLGFDAADMNGNSRTGKCQALFNGGNHTGTIAVDLNEMTKQQPSSLASRSSVPHVVRGRYFHRVDDVVRPAGCSNKTGGTFPLLIYPNIVSMLGQVNVDVNGLCLNPSTTYVLMIEQRQTAPCEIVNPSVARCTLPRIQDWGTKTVYFQPQSGLSNDEKAYVGFIYFVPPTIDPMRLDIGDIHSWYQNPPPSPMSIKWYPRNFSLPRSESEFSRTNYFDDSVYNVQLGLYVVGYAEAKNEEARKWTPQHRVLARLATFSNRADEYYRWNPMIEKFHVDHDVEQWYLSRKEQRKELFKYRFGYLKLARIPTNEQNSPINRDQGLHLELPEGLVSSPVSLHWLWTLTEEFPSNYRGNKDEKKKLVKKKAQEMCHSWYDEDGALTNFIKDTESNSSCPCTEYQARVDIGRFMPHPRCSYLFRDISCTETLGAMNCYMSAQNVQGSTNRRTKYGHEHTSYSTHYGQTCCYDSKGFLMQSSYQPVVKIEDSTPYSPGFPTRAYEMGSDPYQGMFEVPGLSTFHHDIMPYYFCCKYADFRCQMFYWRRPSSSCQAYEPAATGSIMGAGVISTLNNRNLVFNEPGIFRFLHAHATKTTPEVQIQVRLERFPDRSVDFGSHNIEQRDLVQPTNATVVTGVVLHSSDADRVHVVLRKDTRRGRYKTSIIVGNVIRYFDNMHLQRFRGVTIYVNNVEKGQAEIFVVLDKAQIGLRIRESYAIDIDRKFQYMESLGLLDVQVSVPPQYKVHRRDGIPRDNDDPKVDGLINPYPDDVYSDQYASTLLWGNVNDGSSRSALLKYKIKGDHETQNVDLQQHSDDTHDLFQARNDKEKMFQAFADHYLKGPVYKVSSKYQNIPFLPQTEADFKQFLRFCSTIQSAEFMTREDRKQYARCPIHLTHLESECGQDVTCIYDAVMLQAQLLGEESRESFHTYIENRQLGEGRYNSCGAMNIEYPEYLIKGPSSGEPAYLEGNTLSFSCFQTHIVKGNSDFTCRRIKNERDNTYRFQWTQGSQPWCRARATDNVLTWLQWIAVALGIMLIPVIIFSTCWAIKQSQKNKANRNAESKEVEMVLLRSDASGPTRDLYTPESSITRFDREPGQRARQPEYTPYKSSFKPNIKELSV
ncbi:unnamed protein product [Auanema sp. JU1783]|nr:unnamed protein product [Auanema sp. JU1783]